MSGGNFCIAPRALTAGRPMKFQTAQGSQWFVVSGEELYLVQSADVVATAVSNDYILPMREAKIIVPFDPTFLLLESLSQTQFIPSGNLLAEAGCEQLSSILGTIERRLEEVCDVKATPDFNCFKLNDAKLEAWLLRKGHSLLENLPKPSPSECLTIEQAVASVMWQFLPSSIFPQFCRLIGIVNPHSIFVTKTPHPDENSAAPSEKPPKKVKIAPKKVREAPRGTPGIQSYFKARS